MTAEPTIPAAPSARPVGAHKAAVALATLGVLAAWTLSVIGVSEWAAWLSVLSINATALSACWLVAVLVERSGVPRGRVVAAVLFYPWATLIFFANFTYFYFFESAATRHISLLAVDLHIIGFFFQQLLPADGWAWLAVLGVGTVGIARFTAKRLRRYPRRLPAYATALSATATALCASTVEEIPHPFVDVVSDVRFRLAHTPTPIDPLTTPGGSITLLDKSGGAPAAIRTRFKKIVVIIMETVPADTFARDVRHMPPDAFFRRMSQHAHTFTNYHTPNQDSRTAMLAMLLSRWIPYEAYDEAGLDQYNKVADFPSLPEKLHALGYSTSYAFAQVDSELVVWRLPWQDLMNLSVPRIDSLKGKALCYHPYEFENSCEDKVLLPDVVDYLSKHEKAFVFQEFMWGHNLQYNYDSGKSNVQYVNEYVDSLWKVLTKKGLADQTLLVLTADHGDKRDDRLTDPLAYRVPLIFYANRFTPERDSTLYSHLDFKELLLRELDPRRRKPPGEPFVEIIAPTESNTRAVVDSAGGWLVYMQRGPDTYLLKQGGARPPALAPHVRLYDEYRKWFERTNP